MTEMIIALVVAVFSFALGSYLGSRRGAHTATDYTLAIVAMTFYVTYGEEWWTDFLEEMKAVRETEHDSIRALFHEIQRLRVEQ